MRVTLLLPAALASSLILSCGGPPPVHVQAEPASAKIFRVTQAGDTLVGTGSGDVRVEKDVPTRIVVQAEGFDSERRTVTRVDAERKTPLRVKLTRRVVHMTVMPYDADIVVDGVPAGRRALDLMLDSGAVRTVEVRKPGFRTISRTYSNRAGADVPPASETIELSNRAVLVTVSPAGAALEVAGKVIGETSGEVVVPRNGCATVRATRRAFVAVEKTYCQQDGGQETPMRDVLSMDDREVRVTTQPQHAAIFVSGKEVGAGEYPVVVRRGGCVEVEVTAGSFLPTTRSYCNQDNARGLEVLNGEDFVKLETDESWPLTVESDQANVNFQVDVGEARHADDAWRILSQIITSQFDVLEVTDKETGYLRTGWNIRTFRGAVIRTRVIVKLASLRPMKYTLKLVSEKAVGQNVDIKDDQLFKPTNRILLQYKDLINEAQMRLR